MFQIILTLSTIFVVINGGRLQSNFRLKNSPLRFSRQEVAPTNLDDSIETNANGYKPSGWKPEGRELSLPTDETVNNPEVRYGLPTNTYGAPDNRYITPDNLAPQSDAKNKDEFINQDSEIITADEEPEIIDQSQPSFIQLPNGEIQVIKKTSPLKIKPAKLVAANLVMSQLVPQFALLQPGYVAAWR